MSIGCIILYHPFIMPYTKSLILRSVFQQDDIEIEVLNPAKSVIYFKTVRKELVWQTTANLESEGIFTVYAFSHSKQGAYEKASTYLKSFIAE